MKKKLFLSVISICLLIYSAAGVDIYVRAGDTGGNGSIDRPFGSIADAFDMGVYNGDVIHVTEGIYYGKGGSGKWVINKNGLTLAGGYNRDFSLRNPREHVSLLIRGMGEGALGEARKKGLGEALNLSMELTKSSYNPRGMIIGEKDHSNTVIDGFVIDGFTRLTYRKDGSLKTDVGPIGVPLVNFSSPGCKIRNCVVLNSGGPGIRLKASGKKDDPDSLSEVENCIILNTLMEALDFRVGTFNPSTDPDGGYGSITNCTIAFVWPWLDEGYGLLVGKQTRLAVKDTILSYTGLYGINNGLGNREALLEGNLFFMNGRGAYRFFDTKNKITLVDDSPEKWSGRTAKRKYFLNSKSGNNFLQKISLKPYSETFTDKKVFAPIFEHKNIPYRELYEGKGAGVRVLRLYKSSVVRKEKEYLPVTAAGIPEHLGKDVEFVMEIGSKEPASYYIEGITRDSYDCYRSKDMKVFIYIPKGSEALEIIEETKEYGEPALLKGTLVDIYKKIKMSRRYGFIVDSADYAD